MLKLRSIRAAFLAAFLSFWTLSGALAADGGGAVTRHFAASDESSAATVHHSAWDGLLGRYVSTPADGIARFDYGAVTEGDRQILETYLAELEATHPTALGRDEQLAYWINFYNALTVKVVLDHYPVRSIRQIKFGRLFAIGPWEHDLATVEGTPLSLADMEHRILRPIFEGPRIHYAINCASLGCPNLRTEAYVASRIDEQLESAARDYVNHPRGALVEDGRLTVSSIYDWFERDFGGSDESVIAHLRQYAAEDLRASLEGIDRIHRHRYDWALNAPAAPEQAQE